MMYQNLKNWLGVFIVAVFSMSILFSPQVNAAACDKSALGYPAWNNGLECNKDGTLQNDKLELNSVWVIALNAIQWIIVTVGYVALGMIIWGGFQYITGQGEPSKIEAAKSSLLNAVIGLVIVLSAVMILRTVQTAILKGSLL